MKHPNSRTPFDMPELARPKPRWQRIILSDMVIPAVFVFLMLVWLIGLIIIGFA